MGASGTTEIKDNDNYKLNDEIGKGNEPKNIKFYLKKIEKEPNDFEIEYIWEFILDNQNISIIYIHNLKLNKRKIQFNKKLITEEIINGNDYSYGFYEEGHNYNIIHEKDIPHLYIDFKYFKTLNSFQINNDSENSLNPPSKPIIVEESLINVKEKKGKDKEKEKLIKNKVESEENKKNNINNNMNNNINNLINNNILYHYLNNMNLDNRTISILEKMIKDYNMNMMSNSNINNNNMNSNMMMNNMNNNMMMNNMNNNMMMNNMNNNMIMNNMNNNMAMMEIMRLYNYMMNNNMNINSNMNNDMNKFLEAFNYYMMNNNMNSNNQLILL